MGVVLVMLELIALDICKDGVQDRPVYFSIIHSRESDELVLLRVRNLHIIAISDFFVSFDGFIH